MARLQVRPANRPGEVVSFLASGLGKTKQDAPWGDVATSLVQPAALIEAYVGGKPARILSAELSNVYVGYFEVRMEVPPIAPDFHVVNFRIDGKDVFNSSGITVSP